MIKRLIKYVFILFVVSNFTSVYAQGTANVGFGVQKAWENPRQNLGEGQSLPGYARMDWEPGKVMPVRLRDGMITVINFPSWEKIDDAYIGDKDFFNGRPITKNTFLLSPVDGRAIADTNLVIIGKSGNKYLFYLKSEPVNSTTITNTEIDIIVPSSYSGKKAAATMNGGVAAGSAAGGNLSSLISKKKTSSLGVDYAWEGEDFGWIKTIPVDPSEFRFDLDIYVPNPSDYKIAPERVWRDQVFTYIDFGEKALYMNQRPAVSLLVEGGESPVGFRTEGPLSRLIVVEAIGDIVLRSGGSLVCIKKRSRPYLAQMPTINSKVSIPEIEFERTVLQNNSYNYNNQQNFVPNAYRAPMQQTAPIRMYNADDRSSDVVIPVSYKELEFKSTFEENKSSSFAYLQQKNISRNPNGALLPSHYVPVVMQAEEKYAVELGKAHRLRDLEDMWASISGGANNPLSYYEEFYSLETQGVDELGARQSHSNEVYRLRVGPFNSLQEADDICGQISSFRINCSVVRIQ